MIDKKLRSYEAPTTDVLELRSEGMICQSIPYGALGIAGDDPGLTDPTYDFGSF